MGKRTIFLPLIGLVILGFLYVNRNHQIIVPDQVATSTSPVINDESVQSIHKASWLRYKNSDLGISFDYYGYSENNFSIIKGDTGERFGAAFNLPSGTNVWVVSESADYSVGKGSTPGATEGYVSVNNAYYFISHGKVLKTEVYPDEVWSMRNGEKALVFFGKNFDSDYPDWPVFVTFNVHNQKFSGASIILHYEKGDHKPTSQDMEYLKRIVYSIEF